MYGSKYLSRLFLLGMTIFTMVACTHMEGSVLNETHWNLVGWSISSQRATDAGITAKFASGNLSGSTGVNTYSGPYAATSGGRFSAGPLQITEIGGSPTAMRAESVYMTLLGQASSYKTSTSDGMLRLYDSGGNESLIFEPARK